MPLLHTRREVNSEVPGEDKTREGVGAAPSVLFFTEMLAHQRKSQWQSTWRYIMEGLKIYSERRF